MVLVLQRIKRKVAWRRLNRNCSRLQKLYSERGGLPEADLELNEKIARLEGVVKRNREAF